MQRQAGDRQMAYSEQLQVRSAVLACQVSMCPVSLTTCSSLATMQRAKEQEDEPLLPLTGKK